MLLRVKILISISFNLIQRTIQCWEKKHWMFAHPQFSITAYFPILILKYFNSNYFFIHFYEDSMVKAQNFKFYFSFLCPQVIIYHNTLLCVSKFYFLKCLTILQWLDSEFSNFAIFLFPFWLIPKCNSKFQNKLLIRDKLRKDETNDVFSFKHVLKKYHIFQVIFL